MNGDSIEEMKQCESEDMKVKVWKYESGGVNWKCQSEWMKVKVWNREC